MCLQTSAFVNHCSTAVFLGGFLWLWWPFRALLKRHQVSILLKLCGFHLHLLTGLSVPSPFFFPSKSQTFGKVLEKKISSESMGKGQSMVPGSRSSTSIQLKMSFKSVVLFNSPEVSVAQCYSCSESFSQRSYFYWLYLSIISHSILPFFLFPLV